MKRYITRAQRRLPKSGTFFENDEGQEAYVNHTCDVFEPENMDPIDTGLMDQHGNPILVLPYRNPIGFMATLYED